MTALLQILLGQAGTGQSVLWEPTYSLWGVVGAVVLGIVLTIRIYPRAHSSLGQIRVLVLVRCLVLLILGWMLLGYVQQTHTTDKPDLVILLDDSASMSLAAGVEDLLGTAPNGASVLSRLEVVKQLFRAEQGAIFAQLSQRYHVRPYLMGAKARLLSSDPDELQKQIADLSATQSTSQQGDVLQSVLESQRGRPTAAILCVTDGIVTQGISFGDAMESAAKRRIPVYVIALGSESAKPRLEITSTFVPPITYLGNSVAAECQIEMENLEGNVVVELLEADEAGKSLAKRTLAGSKRLQRRSITLFHRETELGPKKYRLKVTHEAESASPLTEERPIQFEVVEARHRVLLVQSTPSYEYRFLKALLERELPKDPSTGKSYLRTWLQDADADFAESDSTAEKSFPATLEALQTYDAVILGDADLSKISTSSQTNLVKYVTELGGSLVILSGPQHCPASYGKSGLASLLPMRLADLEEPTALPFRPRVTPLGESLPLFQWRENDAGLSSEWKGEFPEWNWLVPIRQLHPGVQVLLEHPTQKMRDGLGMPLVTFQLFGKGKILFQATDETYRWRYQAGDTYFGRYWMQVLQFLAPSAKNGPQAVQISTSRQVYSQGEPVWVYVQGVKPGSGLQRENTLDVVITSQEGAETTLSLEAASPTGEQYEGSVSSLPEGIFVARLALPALQEQASTDAKFVVEGPKQELAQRPIPFRNLKKSAESSGGGGFRPPEMEALLKALPEGNLVRIASAPPVPLWNHPLMAGLLAAMLAAEWLLRRHWRLA